MHQLAVVSSCNKHWDQFLGLLFGVVPRKYLLSHDLHQFPKRFSMPLSVWWLVESRPQIVHAVLGNDSHHAQGHPAPSQGMANCPSVSNISLIPVHITLWRVGYWEAVCFLTIVLEASIVNAKLLHHHYIGEPHQFLSL